MFSQALRFVFPWIIFKLTLSLRQNKIEMKMKKKIFAMALWCSMALNSHAQDTIFPVADLYDTDMINMLINAYRETADVRMQKYNDYNYYSDCAIEAYNKKKWSDAVVYVNQALSTGYYCGMLYFIRGFAYERCGYWDAAKKDYKKSIKYNYMQAEPALIMLKDKIKRYKKRK